MGSRALRALRGELVLPGIRSTLDDDDDENEEAEQRRRHPAFAIMNDDDEDDVSSSSSDKGDEDDLGAGKDSNEEVKTKQEVASLGADDKQQELVDEEEDLDALLIEFQEKDNLEPLASGQADAVRHDASPFDLILASFDARDLDYEYSMRTSMLNTGREPSSSTYNQQRQRKYPLFGPPRDGWVRPPRLIGGGIGMTTHDVDASRPLPWPYCNGNNTGGKASWQWCTFVHSDTYERIIQEYRTVIQQSGDLDALVMFVAHHPYVTAALMQMTTVLYQTNHSQDGLALLRRCLWVFESSALATFVNEISDGKVFLMDRDQPENAVFFQALFRLVQVSHIAG